MEQDLNHGMAALSAKDTHVAKAEGLAPSKTDFIVTGEQLIEMKQDKLNYLIEGVLPRTGAVALVGSSDTGKSSFLRQLALSIVYKDVDFMGFPINAQHHNVIYVSTEDDNYAMAYLLNKQKDLSKEAKDLKGLRFIFDTDKVTDKLEKALQQPTDCVIIDTFTDLYSGDLVAANKVRSYINDFVNLSKKHNCLFIFLHHTGKRTESFPPSKDNILGSQGFEAKMRLVMELRKDFSDSQIRHLCIVKGNYVRDKDKLASFALKFDENMRYTNTGKRIPFNLLVKPDFPKSHSTKAQEKAIELKKAGHSITKIKEQLTTDGFQYSRSTIGNWVKNCPSVQNHKEDVDLSDDDRENEMEDTGISEMGLSIHLEN